jgi:hypothetical protein
MNFVSVSLERFDVPEKYIEFFRFMAEHVSPSFVLAGGAVRDIMFGQEVSDFDYFFIGRNDWAEKERFFEENSWKRVHSSDRLTTFKKNGIKVQLIKREYEDLYQLLNSFDFTHCVFAYDGLAVYTSSEALLDTPARRLIVNRITPDFALDSFRRMIKYIQRGYTICDKELTDMLRSVRELEGETFANQAQFYPDGNMRFFGRFD